MNRSRYEGRRNGKGEKERLKRRREPKEDLSEGKLMKMKKKKGREITMKTRNDVECE